MLPNSNPKTRNLCMCVAHPTAEFRQSSLKKPGRRAIISGGTLPPLLTLRYGSENLHPGTEGNRCRDPESSTGPSSMLKRGSKDGRIGVWGSRLCQGNPQRRLSWTLTAREPTWELPVCDSFVGWSVYGELHSGVRTCLWCLSYLAQPQSRERNLVLPQFDVQGFVEAHGRLPLSEGRQKRSEWGQGSQRGSWGGELEERRERKLQSGCKISKKKLINK